MSHDRLVKAAREVERLIAFSETELQSLKTLTGGTVTIQAIIEMKRALAALDDDPLSAKDVDDLKRQIITLRNGFLYWMNRAQDISRAAGMYDDTFARTVERYGIRVLSAIPDLSDDEDDETVSNRQRFEKFYWREFRLRTDDSFQNAFRRSLFGFYDNWDIQSAWQSWQSGRRPLLAKLDALLKENQELREKCK